MASIAQRLKEVTNEMRHRAEDGCDGDSDIGPCCGEDSDLHPEDWCGHCLMGFVAQHADRLDADGRALKENILDLRDALSYYAHPERGWALTAHADVFEASRRLVPDSPTHASEEA
jgi:hypothetical protein